MHYRVYVRGPDELHFVVVESEEAIEPADRLNQAASSANPFVELGGETFRADAVVAVAEEVDRSNLHR